MKMLRNTERDTQKKNAGGVEEGTSQDEYLCVPVLVQEFCLSVEKTLM